MYMGKAMSDVYELVDADDMFSAFASIVRERKSKHRCVYHLTVWQKGMRWIDYTADFTSLTKAQAVGIAMTRLN